jgi:hypothetical protein
MASQTIPRTHAECEAALPPVNSAGIPQNKLIFLGGGLCLQLSPSRPDANGDCAISRSWVYSYSMDGRKRRMGLGSISELTLEKARVKVDRLQEDVANGIDPLEQKRDEKDAREQKRAARKNAKTLMRRLGQKETPHGMRASLRTWAAEKASEYPYEVAEACLAHYAGGVKGRYERAEFIEQRRGLLEKWGAYCSGSEPSNVVSLRRSA